MGNNNGDSSNFLGGRMDPKNDFVQRDYFLFRFAGRNDNNNALMESMG